MRERDVPSPQRQARLARTGRVFAIALSALFALTAARVEAAEDPLPLNKLLTAGAQDVLIETLGMMPYGQVPAAFFTAADYAHIMGEAAVDREDEVREARIVLMNADAARLRSLVANGQSASEEAQVAKTRLREHAAALAAKHDNRYRHLLAITGRHFDYAVARASAEFVLGEGLSRFFKIDPLARFLRKHVYPGGEIAFALGNRSALRPWLHAAGWRKFGTRARASERYVNKISDTMLEAMVAEIVSGQVDLATKQALDRLYDSTMADHPSRPITHLRVREQLIAQPIQYAPLAALAVPAPAFPLAAAPAAPAPAAVLRVSDPVARAIQSEDRFMLYEDWEGPASRQPQTAHVPIDTPPPAPPPEPPAPSARDLERQRERHQELMCVGAGNKPGCERWTSTTHDAKPEGSWDGRRGESIHDPNAPDPDKPDRR